MLGDRVEGEHTSMYPHCFSGDLQKARESFKTKFMFSYLCFRVNQMLCRGQEQGEPVYLWKIQALTSWGCCYVEFGLGVGEEVLLGLACSTVQGHGV